MKKKNKSKKLLLIIPVVIIIIILTIVIANIVRENSVNKGDRKGTIKGNTIVYEALGETTWCSRTCEVKNSSIAKIKTSFSDDGETEIYEIKPLKSGKTKVNCYIKCCGLKTNGTSNCSKSEKESFQITTNKALNTVIIK